MKFMEFLLNDLNIFLKKRSFFVLSKRLNFKNS